MSNWIEISVGIFTIMYTGVNIAKGLWSLCDTRKKELENTIADGVDYTWTTYIKELKKNNNWNNRTKEIALNKCIEYVKSRVNGGYCESNTRIERLIRDRVNYKKKNKYIKKNKDIILREL